MKVKSIINIMNDHGTRPHIEIRKRAIETTVLVYEGRPQNIDEELLEHKVNSFTAVGEGKLKIYIS